MLMRESLSPRRTPPILRSARAPAQPAPRPQDGRPPRVASAGPSGRGRIRARERLLRSLVDLVVTRDVAVPRRLVRGDPGLALRVLPLLLVTSLAVAHA